MTDKAVMFDSPMKNLNDFFKQRPPLIIFLFCLIFLAITTFLLAFYVAHNDHILNSDELEEWNGMIDYFNHLSICINGNYPNSEHIRKSSKYYDKSVTVEVGIDDWSKFGNLSGITVEGRINLVEWYPKCSKSSLKPNYFEITLTVPTTKMMKVCLTLTGPDDYLPYFAHNNNCTSMLIERNKTEVNTKLSIHGDLPDRNKLICRNSWEPKFMFRHLKNDDFFVYLDPEEKSVIYVHLMWGSYVLVLVIIILLIYAIFNKRTPEDTSEHLTYLIN